MAGPVPTPQSRPGLSPAQEVVERARGLAGVLAIPTITFAGRERRAYLVMAHLLSMPAIREFAKRHDYGNEILKNADLLLPLANQANSAFIGLVGARVIEMQEFPFWFTHLTMPNDKLVSEYRMVTAILYGMSWIGIGPIAVVPSAAKAAIASGQKVAASGARAVLMESAQGFVSGAGKAVTGGLGGGLAVAWVVGVLAATAMKDRQTMLKRELDRRFAEGELSADLYRAAVGSDSTLPYVYFTRVH